MLEPACATYDLPLEAAAQAWACPTPRPIPLPTHDDHTLFLGPASSFTAHPYLHDKLPYRCATCRRSRASAPRS